MGIAGGSMLLLGLQVSVTCVAPRVVLTDSCSFFFLWYLRATEKFVYAHYFKAMTIAVVCLFGAGGHWVERHIGPSGGSYVPSLKKTMKE